MLECCINGAKVEVRIVKHWIGTAVYNGTMETVLSGSSTENTEYEYS